MDDLRLIDSDEESLRVRIARALAADPDATLVARFTYWYTSRPPVFEAIVGSRPC